MGKSEARHKTRQRSNGNIRHVEAVAGARVLNVEKDANHRAKSRETEKVELDVRPAVGRVLDVSRQQRHTGETRVLNGGDETVGRAEKPLVDHVPASE